MDRVDAPATMRVSIAWSPRAGAAFELQLSLNPGATVADALREGGVQARLPGFDLATAPIGIWGALCRREDVLREGDRVEVYRPLVVDPKEARRKRHQAQRRR